MRRAGGRPTVGGEVPALGRPRASARRRGPQSVPNFAHQSAAVRTSAAAPGTRLPAARRRRTGGRCGCRRRPPRRNRLRSGARRPRRGRRCHRPRTHVLLFADDAIDPLTAGGAERLRRVFEELRQGRTPRTATSWAAGRPATADRRRTATSPPGPQRRSPRRITTRPAKRVSIVRRPATSARSSGGSGVRVRGQEQAGASLPSSETVPVLTSDPHPSP